MIRTEFGYLSVLFPEFTVGVPAYDLREMNRFGIDWHFLL